MKTKDKLNIFMVISSIIIFSLFIITIVERKKVNIQQELIVKIVIDAELKNIYLTKRIEKLENVLIKMDTEIYSLNNKIEQINNQNKKKDDIKALLKINEEKQTIYPKYNKKKVKNKVDKNYKEITILEGVREDNLIRITNINGETFNNFTIYIKPESFIEMKSQKCFVKTFSYYGVNRKTLTTGKPFKCGDKYYELENKFTPPPFSLLLNNFVNGFLLGNLGKMFALLGFIATFIVYMMTHKGAVLFLGIMMSLVFGGIIGIASILTPASETSFKTSIMNDSLKTYYDEIEKEKGIKVFRRGIN